MTRWFNSGGDRAGSLTFFVNNPTLGSIKSSINIQRYDSVSMMPNNNSVFNTWVNNGVNGNANDPIIPLLQGFRQWWVMCPGDTLSPVSFADWRPWVSVDFGFTWTQVTSPFTPASAFGEVRKIKLAVHSDNNGQPVIGLSGIGRGTAEWSFFSNDLGQTWSAYGLLPAKGAEPRIPRIVGAGTQTVIAVRRPSTYNSSGDVTGWAGSDVYTSRNNGASWALVNQFANLPQPVDTNWPFLDKIATIDNVSVSGSSTNRFDGTQISMRGKGDFDPVAQTFRDDSDRTRELIYVGNNTWIRTNRLANINAPVGGPKTFVTRDANPAISTNGGATFVNDASGRFTTQVYTQRNYLRVYPPQSNFFDIV